MQIGENISKMSKLLTGEVNFQNIQPTGQDLDSDSDTEYEVSDERENYFYEQIQSVFSSELNYSNDDQDVSIEVVRCL